MNSITEVVKSKTPGKSSLRKEGFSRGAEGGVARVEMIAMGTPSVAMNQKIQRHEAHWVKMPPSTIPRTLPKADEPPNMDIPKFCSCGSGNHSMMSERPEGTVAAAATPMECQQIHNLFCRKTQGTYP